jgi:hypothetical protein
MAKCVVAAMKKAGLGVNGGSADPTLFMVNEAEAACVNALDSGFHTILVSSGTGDSLLRKTDVFLAW